MRQIIDILLSHSEVQQACLEYIIKRGVTDVAGHSEAIKFKAHKGTVQAELQVSFEKTLSETLSGGVQMRLPLDETESLSHSQRHTSIAHIKECNKEETQTGEEILSKTLAPQQVSKLQTDTLAENLTEVPNQENTQVDSKEQQEMTSQTHSYMGQPTNESEMTVSESESTQQEFLMEITQTSDGKMSEKQPSDSKQPSETQQESQKEQVAQTTQEEVQTQTQTSDDDEPPFDVEGMKTSPLFR